MLEKECRWKTEGYLCLNGSVRTDVESVEDHIEVASGGGHEEEEEVEV